ncbi:hypothetical protein RvY_04614-2 [Ramazzottius varieornatus]|uniref:Uncharacterized protein n=1 Tax=Ramazzottius varieornatus TaxID=947166 RepID=A0A1D1US77_RAMVA|nr:hypothetical protein RvY_04614-2 [Ramazzottius varieornatus]
MRRLGGTMLHAHRHQDFDKAPVRLAYPPYLMISVSSKSLFDRCRAVAAPTARIMGRWWVRFAKRRIELSNPLFISNL